MSPVDSPYCNLISFWGCCPSLICKAINCCKKSTNVHNILMRTERHHTWLLVINRIYMLLLFNIFIYTFLHVSFEYFSPAFRISSWCIFCNQIKYCCLYSNWNQAVLLNGRHSLWQQCHNCENSTLLMLLSFSLSWSHELAWDFFPTWYILCFYIVSET